jgi:N-formylmethionyl-tRNA deformylase
MGHPLLEQVAAPVTEFGTPELQALIADMNDTMRALNGAGIAAPQIGVSLRVVIFEVKENPRYPHVKPVPYTVLINPVLTPLDDEIEEGWEGCLSVPGMRGLVPRLRRLRYRGPGRGTAESSTGRSRASTPASSSTKSIISTAFSIRDASAICATSASKKSCSGG